MKKGDNKKLLGIVTARGGSVSIPRKNIKLLGGKPLLWYTAEGARQSGIFDRLILSTDDEEIASVGRDSGLEVPFIRPKDLAQNTTPTLPVLIHALTELKKQNGYTPEYTMILQPTTPFRQPFEIKEAFKIIQDVDADSVIGVEIVPEAYNPSRTMFKNESGFLVLSNGDPIRKRRTRRQDLPESFFNTCSIYVFRTELLFSDEPNFFGDKVAPYVMDGRFTLDINDPEDWKIAEDRLAEILKSGPLFQ